MLAVYLKLRVGRICFKNNILFIYFFVKKIGFSRSATGKERSVCLGDHSEKPSAPSIFEQSNLFWSGGS